MKNNFEFSLDLFWKIGVVCFVLIGLGNIYSLIHYWSIMDLGEKVSKIFSTLFNFVLAYFFYWMVSKSKKDLDAIEDLKSNDEMLDLLNDEMGKEVLKK